MSPCSDWSSWPDPWPCGAAGSPGAVWVWLGGITPIVPGGAAGLAGVPASVGWVWPSWFAAGPLGAAGWPGSVSDWLGGTWFCATCNGNWLGSINSLPCCRAGRSSCWSGPWLGGGTCSSAGTVGSVGAVTSAGAGADWPTARGCVSVAVWAKPGCARIRASVAADARRALRMVPPWRGPYSMRGRALGSGTAHVGRELLSPRPN